MEAASKNADERGESNAGSEGKNMRGKVVGNGDGKGEVEEVHEKGIAMAGER